MTALIACQQEQPSIDYVTFSGKITNSDAEAFLVYNDDFKKKIEINEDGTFADTLFIEENGYFSYRIDRESSALYLEKGYQVDLSIDTEEFDESIVYTGKGADENNLLAKLYLLNEDLMPTVKEVYELEEEDFLTKVEMIRTKNEELIQQSKASESVKKQQLEDAKYGYALALTNYENYHSFFTKNEDFTASKNLDSKQIEFDLNNEEVFSYSENYRNLVMSSVDNQIESANEGKDNLSGTAIEVISKLQDGLIKEEVLNYYSRFLLTPDEGLQANYEFLIANTTDEETKTAYTENYDVLKNLLKGMPSPTFTDYENHKGGTTSLADLKGKYTYIDVWATWCGPCKREIPHLKEIEEEYHDKNIQFVSTSIDRAKDHETWVNMVTDEELSGMQLMADNDWNSQFVRDYGIDGIPRFILIDPDGNIVDADAPRPSNPDLKALFEELNI